MRLDPPFFLAEPPFFLFIAVIASLSTFGRYTQTNYHPITHCTYCR